MNQTDPNLLVFTEYPLTLWLVGGMFTLFGLFFLVTPGGLVGGLIGVIAGLGITLLGSVDTITLDKNLNRFSLRRRYLWRTTTQEHPLDEIAGFELDKSQSSDSGRTYRIIAVLAGGRSIPLTSAFTSGHERKRRRVDQLNQWLGLGSPPPAGSGIASRPAAQIDLSGAAAPEQSGETAGVSWQIQQLRVGDAPITRWFSPNFKLNDGFLLLAQKPEGMRIPGKLLGGLGRMFGQQALGLYGFSPADTPGIESAAPLEPPEPRLEPYYITLTSNSLAARQVLNPWTMQPLVAWAERNPVQQASAGKNQAQLVVLFSPQGVYLAALSTQDALETEALTSLGVELVRAQGG
jgi:hypothetical protein